MRDALHKAAQNLHRGEHLVAYLDDIYIVTRWDWARQAYEDVMRSIRSHTGIEANLGKTESWSKSGGPPPRGINELGETHRPPVWEGDLPASLRGIKVLGSPVGTPEYTRRWSNDKLQEEKGRLDQIARMPSVQSRWLLLSFFGSPRANHVLRTTPPSRTAHHADGHDEAVRQCPADQ